MSIWHVSEKIADRINVSGYASIVGGTIIGLVGYLWPLTKYSVYLLVASPILVVVGTIATFWASGVRSINSDRAIASANAKAEEARLASFDAQISLEREKQARMRLEQAIQHRRLSSETSDCLIEKLRDYARTEGDDEPYTAAVFAVSPTMEANNFAEQLADVFASAGFRINRHPVMYGKNYVLTGVGILTSDSAEAIERGAAIGRAFIDAGISTTTIPPRPASKHDKSEGSRRFDLGVSIAVGDLPQPSF